mgnify:CR=1 FL=1
MLKKLDIPQPQGETATTVEEALVIAQKIGYPVLVRPSYVLGGRAMEIVHNDEELKIYMATASRRSAMMHRSWWTSTSWARSWRSMRLRTARMCTSRA